MCRDCSQRLTYLKGRPLAPLQTPAEHIKRAEDVGEGVELRAARQVLGLPSTAKPLRQEVNRLAAGDQRFTADPHLVPSPPLTD